MSERLDVGNLDQLGPSYRGHRFRYHIARGFILPSDLVIDVCCGMGYGASIVGPFKEGKYAGFDYDKYSIDYATEHFGNEKHSFKQCTFADWTAKEKGIDVAIAFECLEHLHEPLEDSIAKLKRATSRLIICSVPIKPTTEINIHHRRDITHQEMVGLLNDDEWHIYESCLQRDIYGIYVVYNKKHCVAPSL